MIGASVALTGPIPDPGRDIANGAEIAIDDLNADGGFMGHDYAIDIQDGACDGDAGTTVANKFASDPNIVAVSGGTCTGETFGLAPILQRSTHPVRVTQCNQSRLSLAKIATPATASPSATRCKLKLMQHTFTTISV